MGDKFQFRRGTASQWTVINPVLDDGEPGIEKDTGRVKFGDGVSAWLALPYAGITTVSYDMLPAGTTITVAKSGATWPSRPTSRTDIVVVWKGADPSPAIGGSGMVADVDYRIVL